MSASRRWPAVVGSVMSLAGLGVSAYLTYAHYAAHATLACPESSIVNCEKVTSSSYSSMFGIPVVLLGLAFFAAMLALQSPAAWRAASRAVKAARLGAVTVGVPMVFWLVYAELFRLRAICLWCTAVHVLTLALFATTVWAAATEIDEAEYDEGEPDEEAEALL